MSNSQMLGLIQLMAECHEIDLSEARAAMIVSDLAGCSLQEVNDAWKKYRAIPSNVKMPTAAQIIQFIPDGHPTAQESWAQIPHDEDGSVVWSDEMRMAFAVARPMIREGNFTGAFFAYKEAYEKLLFEARSLRRKPKWEPSFGFDKGGRDTALQVAVEKNRIPLQLAVKFYPELEYSPQYEQLALKYGGDKIQIDHENKNKILQLVNKRKE